MPRSLLEQLEALEQKRKQRPPGLREATLKSAANRAPGRPKLVRPLATDPDFVVRKNKVKNALRQIATPPSGRKPERVEQELKILAEYFTEAPLGTSQHAIQKRHGMARGYISHAMSRLFPDKEKLKETLYSLNLENAIVSHLVFQKKAEELSPKDAAIAAGIFTQRFAELERLTSDPVAPPLNVDLTIKLEQTLDKIKKIHGPVIDITPKD